MYKKITIGILLVVLMFVGSVSYASAQGISLAQVIEILINIGVIAPDKAAAARAILGGSQGVNTATTNTATKPFMVTFPTAKAQLYAGQTYNLTWTGGNTKVTEYAVYLVGGQYSSTGSRYLGTAYPKGDGGTFYWTIPEDLAGGNYQNYQIQFSGKYVEGGNSPSFGIGLLCSTCTKDTVTNQANTPYIKITHPLIGYSLSNGGKTAIGYINWTTQNFGNLRVNINLISSSGYSIKTIAENIANTGSYYWQNDPSIPTGKYQILLGSADKGPSAESYSGLFDLITNPTTDTQAIFVTCSAIAYPDSVKATWNASVSGGSGSYTYSWSAYNDPSAYTGGSTNSSGFTASYYSAGTKQALVRVSDSSGKSATAYCSATIAEKPTTTSQVGMPQACSGTEPSSNGYAQKGYGYYSTGYSPSSWSLTTGTPNACQYSCINGGIKNGSGCSAPVVTLTNGISYDVIPSSVLAGEVINMRVSNRGTKTWGSSHDLALSTNNLSTNLQMVNLGSTLPNSMVFVSLRAPTTPGTYIIRAVEQNVEWFGSNQTITVTAPQTQEPSTSISSNRTCVAPGSTITLTSTANGSPINSNIIQKDSPASGSQYGDGVFGTVADFGTSGGSRTYSTVVDIEGYYDFKSVVNGNKTSSVRIEISPSCELSMNGGSSNLGNVLVGYEAVIKLLQALR